MRSEVRVLLYGAQAYSIGVLGPLAREFTARAAPVAWFIEGAGAEHLPQGSIHCATIAEARAFDPDLVLVSADVVPHFLPGLKVAVFHGLDARKRSPERGHFRVRGYFDLYCTHGPSTTEPFQALAAQHGHFEVVETGFAKLDPAFAVADVRSSRRPTVLYSPTMTPELSSATALLDTITRLSARGEWDWLVKMHAKMPDPIVRSYRALQGPHLRYVEDPDLLRAMALADVMVSDTSSAPVEFVVLGRPTVTYRHRDPGPWFIDVQDPSALEGAIRTAFAPPDALLGAMHEYAMAVHPYRDGRSSARIAAAALDLMARGTGHLRPKPLNLWRKAQARWRHRYFGPA